MKPVDCRRGGIIVRFLLICVVLVVLAGFVGVNLLRNVHLRTVSHNGGDDVSLVTPAGRFHIRAHEKLDPSAVGMPVYPGARRTDQSGGAEFEWVSADGDAKGMSVAGASFITPDPPDKVIDFYRSQFSNLVVVKEKNKSVRLEYTDRGLKRIVAIREEDDGTHIGLAAIGGAAAN